MSAALYIGSVMHRRLRPRLHAFRYRSFVLCFDLEGIEMQAQGLRWLSLGRFNLFSVDPRDHGATTLQAWRARVEGKIGVAGIPVPGGAIRVLAMPRVLGYVFNPLSVYFCHDPGGALRVIVYEVRNTFGERHHYIADVSGDGALRQTCAKRFYVSPFFSTRMDYEFRIVPPDARVMVAITCRDGEGTGFVASLAGEREELTDRALLRLFARLPWHTVKVIAAIHWQALALWLKRVPLVPRVPGTEGVTRAMHGAETAPAATRGERAP